jgi:Zn-dependent M28 family amino/carboxypeptidase
LSAAGYRTATDQFQTSGTSVCNIEAELQGTSHPDEIIVVGGHYDSVRGCPGANDNATGTAAVLEIARACAPRRFPRTVRFVGFVNEEPPFFQTDGMGSLRYARRARQRDDNIVGMLSLETIGYYSDAKGSQRYPVPAAFHLFYPSAGNFIGFVANLASRHLLRRTVCEFRRSTAFPCEAAALPEAIPGVGWSDHWAFWQVGYPGVMVTDTAPYRYPWYHTPDDTPEKIDYERMARVVAGLELMLADLADGA